MQIEDEVLALINEMTIIDKYRPEQIQDKMNEFEGKYDLKDVEVGDEVEFNYYGNVEHATVVSIGYVPYHSIKVKRVIDTSIGPEDIISLKKSKSNTLSPSYFLNAKTTESKNENTKLFKDFQTECRELASELQYAIFPKGSSVTELTIEEEQQLIRNVVRKAKKIVTEFGGI